jgi:hypothetical protein
VSARLGCRLGWGLRTGCAFHAQRGVNVVFKTVLHKHVRSDRRRASWYVSMWWDVMAFGGCEHVSDVCIEVRLAHLEGVQGSASTLASPLYTLHD